MKKEKKKSFPIIEGKNIINTELCVIAGELEDLAYNVECISHTINAFKYLVYYNEAEMSERSGCAVLDLIQDYANDKANEIAELSAQVKTLRKDGKTE